jgi:Isochorismatase family
VRSADTPCPLTEAGDRIDRRLGSFAIRPEVDDDTRAGLGQPDVGVNRLSAASREAGIHGRVLGEIPKIRDGLLNESAESAAFHEALVLDSRDITVQKPRFGAFYGTDLELILAGA